MFASFLDEDSFWEQIYFFKSSSHFWKVLNTKGINSCQQKLPPFANGSNIF